MLEARQLTKFYGSVPAVQDITFQIAPGSVLGYLGPNGSGKSTTVKMLIGLLHPTHGEVLFAGCNIQHDLVAYPGTWVTCRKNRISIRTLPVGNTSKWLERSAKCPMLLSQQKLTSFSTYSR